MADEYLRVQEPTQINKSNFKYRDQEELEKVAEITSKIKSLELSSQDERLKNFRGLGSEEQEEKRAELFDLFDEALDILAAILEERSQLYGELAYECSDIAFAYGELLLRRAKEHTLVLTNAKLQKTLSKRPSQTKRRGGCVFITELNNASSSTHVFGDEPEGEEDEEKEDEGQSNDDVESTMETAFASLEVARVSLLTYIQEKLVCEKDKEYFESKLSNVYFVLGEFGKENENFQQAVEDYENALRLLPESDHRKAATIHYEIAVALMFQQKSEEGLKRLQQSADELKLHIEGTKKDLEVQLILDDLLIRIEEMKDEMTQTEQLNIEKSKPKPTAQPPTDPGKINVLVPRRKPKPTAAPVASEDGANKRKREDEEAQTESKKVKFSE
ncbi:hypothetical protein AKO1_013785 [Acrasis kona]|uniref:Tetratricopeptide SHNi-TPR domain-containing protein n=1 Tax=Acrasis kona TaxID=1008807 RepID=A0AAW2ZKL0_9EUKA